MRKVICKNSNGRKITFGNADPYFLENITGIAMPTYAVYTTKGSTQDGEDYVSANAEKRNILIDVVITKDVLNSAEKLYNIFTPKQSGTLIYYRDDEANQIDYVVESMEIINMGYLKKATLSLICPFPFFQDIAESKLNLAYYMGLIQFPITLPAEPFYMTTMVQNLIVNIPNDSSIDLGMTIKFTANGAVKNPQLFNVDTREFLKMNIQMITGDEITATTQYKNKKVLLKRNGVVNDITALIDNDSTWLQIYTDDNLFRYDADENLNNLEVSIYYRKLKLGVV